MTYLQVLGNDSASFPTRNPYQQGLVRDIKVAFDHASDKITVPSELLDKIIVIDTHTGKGDFTLNVDDSGDRQFGQTEWIHDFPGEPYRIKRPIPATLRTVEPLEIEASFREANIAWVDKTTIEALTGLQVEILNTLEDYQEHEAQLGPEPRRQLEVLRIYIESINP